jgi:hypothetical protein
MKKNATFLLLSKGLLFSFIVLIIQSGQSFSKENDSTDSEPFFSITGSASLSADLYDFTSTPTGSQKGRRPPSLYRFLFSPTITIGSFISLPFNLMLTTPETNTITSSISTPSFSQYLQNPANAFGLLNFSPKIGWAQFSLGSHTPSFSKLTAGDQQLFGLGFDLNPGSFRIAASAGSSQRAIEPDYAKNIKGVYRRDMYMGRVSFGNPDATVIGLNMVYTKDDKSSIHNNILALNAAHPLQTDSSIIVPADTVRLRAEEGMVASADLNMKIGDGFIFNMEGAVSSFTRDLDSPINNIDGNPLSSIQTTRTSTRADFAGNADLAFQQTNWGIKLSGLYMGAGFVPVGYLFMQSDRLEFQIAPNLRLFDGAFSLNASLGQRVNNLSETKGEMTTQLIMSGNMNAEITKYLNISANYSNFGIRNNQAVDTLRVENVSQSFSFEPTLTIEQSSMINIIGAGISLDKFDDFNVISGLQSSNNTRTVFATYSNSFINIPLRFGIYGSYMENLLPLETIIIRTLSFNISYSFLKKTLAPALTISKSSNTLGSNPTDDQIFYKFAIRWQATKMITLNTSFGNNNYNYGNPISKGSSFKEYIFHFSISTRF